MRVKTWRVHFIVQHWRTRFRSPTGGPASRPGTPGQVMTNYQGSTGRETDPCRDWHCTPSASKLPTSSCGNGTTTAQTPKVNPPQHIIQVWQCTIHPGAAATLVYWRPESSTTQGQCRIERSPTPKGYLAGSKQVHGGNHIHEDSLANIIKRHVLDGWRGVETIHWSSGSSAGISRCFCRYAISVSSARQSISQNRSANTRSWKSCILLNSLLSDLGYWLCPKIYILETEDKYSLRTVGR